MSIKFVDVDGEIGIPGAYPSVKVAEATGGIATTGVIALIGEADMGPAYDEEDIALDGGFGPDQFASVVQKFGSGSLVDAFRAAAAPSNDPQVSGAPTRIFLVKTNGGDKASTELSLGTLRAKLAGEPGNLLSVKVEDVSGQRLITIARPGTNTLEEFGPFGGDVVLHVAYNGDAGSEFSFDPVTKQVILTAVAGSGTPGTTTFSVAAFKTLNDLASYIAARTGWTCTLGSKLFGQLPPTVMDAHVGMGVNGAGADIKKDAYDYRKLIATSQVVEFDPGNIPYSELPDAQGVTYFTGGKRGSTLAADFTDALAMAERVRANFVVPLFSRDATDDIADGLTDAASTYAISAIHAALSKHCSAMSQFKKRRPRQGFASVRDSFANAKLAAQNLAAARVACTFQDYKTLAADGTVKQFQPWMGAVVAAGMQAAAFYRPIFNKLIQCSGIVQAAGDFFDSDESQIEDALSNGLLVIRKRETGGYSFVSDQTTYGADNSFVYNSVQAVYAADVVAATVARRMEDAFVGQSFADVSAAVALGYLKGIMSDLRRLKLITASDDAPEGYRNALIQISAPAMMVSLEIKLATGIYFIPIKFLVTAVKQTAQQ